MLMMDLWLDGVVALWRDFAVPSVFLENLLGDGVSVFRTFDA